MKSKRIFLKVLAAAVAAGSVGMFSSTVSAQSSDPVRFVLPLAPGGGSDTIGRAVANEMSKALNTTIVPENKPGASGTIALNEVIRSQAGKYSKHS